jgi:ubiquinol-cytochrome c reductase cytochrome c1 subunit
MTRLLTLLLATWFLIPGSFASEAAELPAQNWSFDGLHGKFDKDQILRGYSVFTGVCMNCHSMKYVSHRDLTRVGFTEEEATTLAKNLNMTLDQKILTAQDDETAQATFGKVPPDLSLMTKAREGLADYVYAVLTGFSEDPDLIERDLPGGLPAGAYYNRAFPGHAIAMPPPLNSNDMVTYHDETKATIDQMARDVTTFMEWAAEPELQERKSMGVYVLLYLIIFVVLAYLTKRVIWKNVKGH